MLSVQIDLVQGMMDCLYAECKPCITDCVLAELEKLGQKYRVALKVAKVRQYPKPSSIEQFLQEGLSARVCLAHNDESLSLQDPRIERLPCTHSGTYADDCICERIRQHKCYIVATCDRDLRRRIRKVSLPEAKLSIQLHAELVIHFTSCMCASCRFQECPSCT